MVRAAALCADAGRGVTEANFWQQQTQTAIRCMLHAAAVAKLPPAVLYEWSLSAAAAKDAVAILSINPDATPTWDRALDAIVSADHRQRDSVWSMVGNALAPLADPQVLAAVSPVEERTSIRWTFSDAEGRCISLAPLLAHRPPLVWYQRSSRTWSRWLAAWQPQPPGHVSIRHFVSFWTRL